MVMLRAQMAKDIETNKRLVIEQDPTRSGILTIRHHTRALEVDVSDIPTTELEHFKRVVARYSLPDSEVQLVYTFDIPQGIYSAKQAN